VVVIGFNQAMDMASGDTPGIETVMMNMFEVLLRLGRLANGCTEAWRNNDIHMIDRDSLARLHI
jgi:hypothetical protein